MCQYPYSENGDIINNTYPTGLLWGINEPKQVKLSELQLAENCSFVTSPVISSMILNWVRQDPQQNCISACYKSGGGGSGNNIQHRNIVINIVTIMYSDRWLQFLSWWSLHKIYKHWITILYTLNLYMSTIIWKYVYSLKK